MKMKPRVFLLICSIALLLAVAVQSNGSDFRDLFRFSQTNGFPTDMATDAAGNIYVCGVTANLQYFPSCIYYGPHTNTEAGNMFLIKLSSAGEVLGTAVVGGSQQDWPYRILLDPSTNVLVVGDTGSSDFPVQFGFAQTNRAGQNIFVCKFDSSATNLLFSAVIGGSDSDFFGTATTDSMGNLLLAGYTSSEDLLDVVIPQWSMPFLLKLSADGSKVLQTSILGGYGYSILSIDALAATPDGGVMLAGNTSSDLLPVTPDALCPSRPSTNYHSSGFLMKLLPSGDICYATYFGGSKSDNLRDVMFDRAGNVVITGTASSPDLPGLSGNALRKGAEWSGFVTRLNPAATKLISTQLLPDKYWGLSRLSTTSDQVVLAGTVAGTSWIACGTSNLALTPLLNPRGYYRQIQAIAPDGDGGAIVMGADVEASLQANASYFVARVGRLSGYSPRVSIVDPDKTRIYPDNRQITVHAVTGGFRTPVQRVTFFDGSKLIGVASKQPYLVKAILSPGLHVLRAVAANGRESASSAAVRIIAKSPANDHFRRRTRLTGRTVQVSGYLDSATDETGQPYSKDVWYSWRPPKTGAYELNLEPKDPYLNGIRVYVYQGHKFRAFDYIAQFTGGVPVSLLCRGGQSYSIRIESGYPAHSAYRFMIRPVEPPANDNFDRATDIPVHAQSVVANLLHATSEPLEPGTRASRTVWYSWTAPAPGMYFACVDDTRCAVEVYSGNTLTNLLSQGRQISGPTNGVSFTAEDGQVYRIRVHGDSAGPQTSVLTISAAEPPANDNFESAFPLEPGGSVTGTCIGATRQDGEPSSSWASSVWWRWTPVTNGVYRLRPAGGQSFWETLTAYKGASISNLTMVANSNDRGELVWYGEAGVTYYIAFNGNTAACEWQFDAAPLPPNDCFSNASPFLGRWITGNTTGASLEPNEPTHRYFGIEDSIWYRWVAPSNGAFTFSFEGGSAGVIEVFSGLELTNLIRHSLPFQAEAGHVFWVAVANAGRFGILNTSVVPPANDNFTNAQVISGDSINFEADTRNATAELDEPKVDEWEAVYPSVWFKWSAPGAGNYLMSCTNVYDLRVSVFIGTDSRNLVLIAEGWYRKTGIDFDALAGVTYYIRVENVRAEGGPWPLTLRFRPPPVNDNFQNRLVLTGAVVAVTGNNGAATSEPGEPWHGGYAPGRSVWWSWTAPITGQVTIMATNADFHPVLAMYTGESLTNLTRESDSSGGVLYLTAQAGTQYAISVASYSTDWSGGHFELRIFYPPAPPNDAFARRIAMTNNSAAGTLVGASLEPTEPGYSNSPNAASVWWEWTAQESGLYEVKVQNEFYRLWAVTLFIGTNLSSLTSAGPDAPDFNRVRFSATAGTTYVIRVLSADSDVSDYELTVARRIPPPNDDYKNRILLTGNNLTISGSNTFASLEPNEPIPWYSLPSSVWWEWCAPVSGICVVSTERSPTWCVPAVFHFGVALSNLVTVDVSSRDYQRWEFPVQAGDCYAISVSGSEGGFELDLSVTPLVVPSPVARAEVNPARLWLNADAGAVIQWSTNLTDWKPWRTNSNSAGHYPIPVGSDRQRFFRVR